MSDLKDSSLYLWAENETKLGCEIEAPNRDKNKWDYGCACYESALKAYSSIIEDGHSGTSFNITAQILERLLKHLPLNPITDEPGQNWCEATQTCNWICQGPSNTHNGCLEYQSSRMRSLFKYVDVNKQVSYEDTKRFITLNIFESRIPQYNKDVSYIMNKLFPLHMPYLPEDEPQEVTCEMLRTNPDNILPDTIYILSVKRPKDDVLNIDRYFKHYLNAMWVEIPKNEYMERVCRAALLNEKKEGKNA